MVTAPNSSNLEYSVSGDEA